MKNKLTTLLALTLTLATLVACDDGSSINTPSSEAATLTWISSGGPMSPEYAQRHTYDYTLSSNTLDYTLTEYELNLSSDSYEEVSFENDTTLNAMQTQELTDLINTIDFEAIKEELNAQDYEGCLGGGGSTFTWTENGTTDSLYYSTNCDEEEIPELEELMELLSHLGPSIM